MTDYLDACRVILCYSSEEALRLNSITIIHGIEGGTANNLFVCNTEDIDRITKLYPVEYIATTQDVEQWTAEAIRDWGRPT